MASDPRKLAEIDKRFPESLSGDNGKAMVVDETSGAYVHSTFPSERLTGEIIMWPTNTPPTGFLICDGAEYSQAAYPALYALLGESTPGNFVVPNINFAKNSRGVDTLTEEAEGVGTHGHVSAAAGSHDHSGNISSAGGHQHGITIFAGTGEDAGSGVRRNDLSGSPGTALSDNGGAHGHTIGISTAGDHSHSVNDHVGVTQPACTLLNFCIKT